MAIPDTSPVSLVAVGVELGLATPYSLLAAIAAADPAKFDPAYNAAPTGLYQFRNYGASLWTVQPDITNIVQSPLASGVTQFQVDFTAGTGVAPVPNHPTFRTYANKNGGTFTFTGSGGGAATPITGMLININAITPVTNDVVIIRMQGEDNLNNFSNFIDSDPYTML